MISCDLGHSPFTLHNSFLKITALSESNRGRLMIATASDIPFIDMATQQKPFNFYEIALYREDQEIPYTWQATPVSLQLQCDNGSVLFAFADTETLTFEADGITTLRLLPCHSICTLSFTNDLLCEMIDYRGQCTQQMRAREGTAISVEHTLTVRDDKGPYGDKPMTITFSNSGTISGAMRFDRYGRKWDSPLKPIKQSIDERNREWQGWLSRMPVVSPEHTSAAEYAWYLLWSLAVPQEGLYTRSGGILMSKNWMNKIWSWDNCFDAIAIVNADPEMAFNQLRLFYDRQAPNGKFPEPLSNSMAQYGYVKPPIYGWTIKKLIQRAGVDQCFDFIKESYDPVCKFTEWWYTHRDRDNDGMCEYHHGNDCGWDNATAFDQGFPTEGSDLGAHLVLQTEVLAEMAELLGKKSEAQKWRERSSKQLHDLLEQSVENDRFISVLDGTRNAQPAACLLNYVPMELGSRLPENIRKAMVADLSPGGDYLTEFGLATESPKSAKYKTNGYWRGPIWAPPTYQIFDGLIDSKETVLAKEIGSRFCRLCETNPGMWENYDPLTGKGLQCPGYSWTSAVYLLIAEWLSANK